MKILHVIDSGGFYGAEAMLVELALEQVKAGHSVTICSIGAPSEREKPIEKACRERGIKVYPLRMKAGLNLLGGMNIVNYAKQHGFDLFHSHGYKGNILLGIIPKILRGLPVVATLHGWTSTKGFSKIRCYELLDAMMIKRLDAVVLVSDAMRKKRGVANRTFSRLSVISNGISDKIPNNHCADQVLDDLLELKSNNTIIGSVGRLSHEKGYDVLLKSFKHIVEQSSNVILVLMGDGPLKSSLIEMSVALGIRNKVKFMGYVSDAGNYIKEFDLYINSSRTEGLPITLLESMRAGVPVVASNVGDNKKLLLDYADLLVFDSGNVTQLTNKIVGLMETESSLECIGKNLRNKFLENYTSRTMWESYERVYETIIRNDKKSF